MPFNPVSQHAWIPIIATVIAFGVSWSATKAAGMSKTTKPGSTIWNRSVGRSPWEPPGWVFSVVWAFLYIGVGLIWYNALRTFDNEDSDLYRQAMWHFGGLTALNILWSFVILLGSYGVINPVLALHISGFILIALGYMCALTALWVYRNFECDRLLSVAVLIVYVAWMATATFLSFTSPTVAY